MNIVDLIIVVIVALGGWSGYRNGFFRQVTRLFGAVIAYFLSWWLRPYIAPVIRSFVGGAQPHAQTSILGFLLGDLSGAISFGLVFIVTFLLLRYAAGLVDSLFSLPVLSTINRLAGLATGLILAIVFVYVAALVAHYVNNAQVQQQLNHSVIVSWLVHNDWQIPKSINH